MARERKGWTLAILLRWKKSHLKKFRWDNVITNDVTASDGYYSEVSEWEKEPSRLWLPPKALLGACCMYIKLLLPEWNEQRELCWAWSELPPLTLEKKKKGNHPKKKQDHRKTEIVKETDKMSCFVFLNRCGGYAKKLVSSDKWGHCCQI